MNWSKELDVVISVCDTEGIIIEMNDKAVRHFSKYSDVDLIGSSLLNCHPEPSKSKLKELMQAEGSNTYIVENQGNKRLITQKPWYQDGKYAGFIEIQVEI
ncbi:MAG: PAS domain-containing protein [Anaerolineaceae bacterium]|jgi:transcriptional regulator with PAS, ATPase and Fis domain|nr:PAS domain-containing protein [Anaerolineaceae bacterium]